MRILYVEDNPADADLTRRALLRHDPQALVEQRVDEPVLQHVTRQVADPQQFVERVRHLYEQREETSQDEIRLADGRVFDRYSAPMFTSGYAADAIVHQGVLEAGVRLLEKPFSMEALAAAVRAALDARPARTGTRG